MDRTKIFNKVLEVIEAQVGESYTPLTEETNLKTDLGFDTLDKVKVTTALESKFGIFIPAKDALSMLISIRTIIDYLENKV